MIFSIAFSNKYREPFGSLYFLLFLVLFIQFCFEFFNKFRNDLFVVTNDSK
jgi:hypothetical protein